VYIRPRENPIIFISLAPLHSGNTTCKHTTQSHPESRVLRFSKWPEPVENRPTLSISLSSFWHEPSRYDQQHRPTQKQHEGTPGVWSDTRHRQLARKVGGVSLIKVSSMVVTFKNKITVIRGAMFHFRTISCIADVEGILHCIADPPEKKLSSGIPREAKASLRTVSPLTARGKMVPCKPGFRIPWEKEDQSVRASLTRITLLSTSPTKEWTWITRKKEVNIPSQGRRTHRATFLIPPPSKEDGKKNTVMPAPFYPDVLFIQGDWSQRPSPTMSLPCKGRNLPSVMPDNEETDAEMCGDIMKSRNGIRRSPCPGTEPQKWGKLPTNKYTEKDATLTAAIADRLRIESES
jgi:hypothetical protein